MEVKVLTDDEKFDERTPVVGSGVLPATMPAENTFFQSLERLMANPEVDPAKIKQFMDMEEHILDRNAEQAFNASMMRAQGKIELVVGKKWNDQTKSHYAPLKDVLIKTKAIYTAEGFSLMFYEDGATKENPIKENHIRVGVDIMHEQGHTKKRYADIAVQTTGIAGKAMMTQVHGEGSAFSYGRRYLTCMIFNIPTGDDDDGNAAGGIEYITEEEKANLEALRSEVKADGKLLLKWLGVEVIEDLPRKKYKMAVKHLESKRKE